MSNTIEGSLGKDEKVIAKAQLSGAALVGAWIFGILCCWMILIPTILAIKKTVQWHNVELVVTNKHIRGKVGVIHTKALDLPLDKVQTVTVNQRFWGKVFGYATITITSAASTGAAGISFAWIKAANQFKTTAMSAISSAQEDNMRKQAEYMAQSMAAVLNK